MKVTFTIAKYTFIEAFRDKFVWFVFAIMLAGFPVGLFIKNVTLYGADTVLPAVVIAVISISVAIVSVLYVNIATRRELDGRIMHIILSRPVSNLSYLLGKHIGFWMVSAVYVFIGSIFVLLMNTASIVLVLQFFVSQLLLQFMVVAWSLFFALLLNSLAASVIVSVMAWILFNSTQTMWYLSKYSDSVISKIIGVALYYVLPNFERYDVKHAILYNNSIDFSSFAILLPYTIVYSAIILIAAWVDFSRKEY